jgi:hypothetical protein
MFKNPGIPAFCRRAASGFVFPGFAGLVFSPSSASAEVWAYTNYAPAGRLQPWTGNPGLDFVVNQSTYVTSPGAFNSTGSNTFVKTIRVGIFDMAGNLQGSLATFAGSAHNGNIGTGSTPPSMMNDGGGITAFVGSAGYDYDSVILQLPTVIDGGPINRCNAGTFEFTTPEPGSFIPPGGGLVFLIKKKRSSGGKHV